jgi:hypothetical protein
MKFFFLFLLFVSCWSAVISSTATASNVTSCTGACCTQGVCSQKTDTACASPDSFNGFFTPCSSVICPPSADIVVIAGCTIANSTSDLCITTWGYSSIINVTIPIGIDNFFSPGSINEGQTTVFKSGLFLNQFTTITPCSQGPLTWLVRFEGENSTSTSFNFTTCTGACCNITYCATVTDLVCASFPLTTFHGFSTNCTSNGGISPCGLPTPINPIANCTINYGNGTCSTAFGYNNTNSVSISIPIGSDNFFSSSLFGQVQTTTFLPGYFPNQFIALWNCLAGSLSWTIQIETIQATPTL